MTTKQQFLNAAAAEIANYPIALQYYRAGDPRLLAPISAIAAMFSLLSDQVDIAETEPFLKSRDATVLADASMKGILPLAKPCKLTLVLTNASTSPVTLLSGRVLLDSEGRDFILDAQVTIPAKVGDVLGTVTANVTQHLYREYQHTVAVTSPFYEFTVPLLDSDTFIESFTVRDVDGLLEYAPDYMIQAGADTTKLFHVETNEFKELIVRFGAAEAYGYQPINGQVVTVQIYDTLGEIVIDTSAGFTLSYINSVNENDIKFSVDTIINNGSNPPSIDVLRILASYPALFDNSAVYLGNFDFIVRKFLSDVRFLSIWNERVEEQVRPPSLDNINTLFVTYVLDGVLPLDAETNIRNIIKRADDSYRVTFVAVNNVEMPLTINATIAPVHDKTAVEQQLRDYMVANYGNQSAKTSVGRRDNFNKQSIYEQLKKNTVALQDPNADLTLVFGVLSAPMPEDWRYITNNSITVNITLLDTGGTGVWN